MAVVLVLAAAAFSALASGFVLFGLLLKFLVRLVLFPLFLLKWIVMALVMMVVGPVVLVGGLLLALALALVLAVPLLPLMFLGLIVWLIATSARRPAVV